MPFSGFTLTARIPPGPRYPLELRTLGDHLKKRRMDLRLRQKDVAAEIGVGLNSYQSWEVGKYEPEFRYWPALIRFLGYDPSPEPQTLGERIRAKRRRKGLTLRELARCLELDLGTIEAWEKGEVKKPYPRLSRLFEEYVEDAKEKAPE